MRTDDSPPLSLQLEMKGKEQNPQATSKHIPSSSHLDSLNNHCEQQLPIHQPRLNIESCNNESRLYGHLREEHKRRKVLQKFSSLPVFSLSSIVMKTCIHTHTHYVTNLQLVLHTSGKQKLLNSELTE